MPIQAPDIFGGFMAGKQARQQQDYGATRNALAEMELQNAPQEMQRRNALADTQLQGAQLQLNAEQAKFAYTKLQQAVDSGNPKAFILQNIPDLAGHLQRQGIDLQSMDDAQAADLTKNLARKYAGEAGIAPAVKLETLQTGEGGILQKDPTTGALKQVVAPQKPDLSRQQLDETIRHNRAMETKPPASGFGALTDTAQADTLAQMIANGSMPMPTGRALLTPLGQYLTQKVSEINPNFTGTTYPSVAAALKAFTSGQESRKVRSLNTAIAHMETLDELSAALNNNDTQAFNRVANFLSKETGGTAVTNFNTAKDLVAKEVISAVVAGGGGQAEREEAAKSFNAANSPAQLAEVTNVYRELLGGQLQSLRGQYEQGTQRTDFDRFLTDRTKRALGNGQQGPTQKPQGEVRVNSPQEAMALQPGTVFITPDGRRKVR